MSKYILSAAVIALTTAGAASADSYFTYLGTQQPGNVVELGTVVSELPGSVELFDYRGGEAGALIGSTAVAAGANSDVRVRVNTEPRADVLAVLTAADGTVLNETRVDIDRN
ncbi:hypothetical protein [Pelagovum pacificum]|uniref:Uncharacterized protein n=1 Tax=Pelagovum pacificum TaxID=2588711 RepID=A0A5C5GBN0_9RHOB|nr:hypothetical protein [Pelagovum pacificum]QQA42414.1 hypothetical protein I8N54_16730 [Pelagovum pacificum]TNY31497.1 hypothetical protein FHY64_15920 [Pelagovum pacificum]